MGFDIASAIPLAAAGVLTGGAAFAALPAGAALSVPGGQIGAMVAGGAAGGFLGGSGGGGPEFEPITQPKLTPEGEKLEKELFKSIKTELFPENLAARFIGDAKKIEQARRRTFERRFAGAGFRGPENIVTGKVARGFLGETAARLRGTQPGVRRAGEARRDFAVSRLSKLQSFINLQSGTPLLRARAGLIKGEQEQAESARMGAAIGSLASLAAISRYLKTES